MMPGVVGIDGAGWRERQCGTYYVTDDVKRPSAVIAAAVTTQHLIFIIVMDRAGAPKDAAQRPVVDIYSPEKSFAIFVRNQISFTLI